ncbi:MAG: spermidine/putrescine ABC transporter substrate-binding protein [Ruminococcaceae bacterium]|nr:spermidine/putrescine ABC transporter substrate-binding protein [Oscillospiraceae bacterium]
MKKIISLTLALFTAFALLLGATSCGSEEKNERILDGGARTLYVYNWGEYISDGSEGTIDTNAEFEKYCREELGLNVTVNYSTFSSNEDLYAKLSSGAVSYDVVIPSDYMVARLASEGLLAELNPDDTIPNYQYISEDFKGLYYDENEIWSVPYTYGTVGVIYNTEMVPEDEENLGSWALMWDEDYTGNILQFNNSRDAFGTAQYYLGYSVNSDNEAEWREALALLIKQKNVVQGYVMDEIFNKMKGGSAAISSYYAGDYFTMYADNERLAFYHPEEGTNVFVDAMCIPKSSQNYDLAVEYINFMLTEEIAIANAEYICYASPNSLVYENETYIEDMTEVHPDAISILYDFDMSKMEFYHDLPTETRMLMNSLWEDLKIESNIGIAIYVICGVIVALGIALVLYNIIEKRRRKYYFDKYAK